MGVDSKIFGQLHNPANEAPQAQGQFGYYTDAKGEKKANSQFWVNLGVQTFTNEIDPTTGEVKRRAWFSQVGGFPLDSYKTLPIATSSAIKNEGNKLSNEIWEDLMMIAQQLELGQSFVPEETVLGLNIQILRRAPAAQAPVDDKPKRERIRLDVQALIAAQKAA